MAIFHGTGANNTLNGTGAADSLFGYGGNDVLNGLAGDDMLRGGVGNDRLDGGTGLDTASYFDATNGITASLLTNRSAGGLGTDTFVSIENLEGSNYGDALTGGALANTLWGRGGNDSLLGQSGDDVLAGGSGNDRLDGGLGLDTATWFDATGAVTASLLTNSATGGGGSDALVGIENLAGSTWNDSLTGNAAANLLKGGSGNDTLAGNGGNGNDTLQGGGGTNTLLGGAGNDRLLGVVFVDSIDGGDGIDTLDCSFYASHGVEIHLEHYCHCLPAVWGIDNVIGTRFNDVIGGNGLTNTLLGGEGNDAIVGDVEIWDSTFGAGDFIDGGDGSDNIDGHGGDDTILGGTGNDAITGNWGNDTLTGGPDSDVFSFDSQGAHAFPTGYMGYSSQGQNLITDYNRGYDKISCAHSAADMNYAVSSQDNFAFLDSNDNGVLDDGDEHVEVKNVTFNGQTKLSTIFDYNAFPRSLLGGGSDPVGELTVFGVTGLTASDFI